MKDGAMVGWMDRVISLMLPEEKTQILNNATPNTP